MSHRDPATSSAPPNRLARESSPYLLQHARNPVDWFPWGPEAVSEARRRNVPIFLSVGYSTCYWCHVMERESFEDPAVGALMSERLVCVKVDREERPDVDQLYMTAVQILTGRGGWPMSVFIEPEKLRPYWAGTYFPPEPRHGLPSFRQALTGMADAWRDKRADVLKQAGAVADAVAAELAGRKQAVAIGRPQISMAVQTLMTIFDRTNGGFGGAPKFPQPVYLELLLDVRARIEEPSQRDAIDVALRTTLDKMALGGMHDQVGGGFHRYSVDAIWLVPHFEKMLYDQAQLLSVYARAATEFNDPFYARVARRTADYVLREMTSPEGAFYTAQDAEVDGQEGLNYLWTIEELNATLPPEDAVFAAEVYGVDDGPNFQDPHHPGNPPRNVLRLGERPEHAAARKGLSTDQFLARLDAINATLYAARAKRKQPGLDDKVLTSWNGLMIGALARAGRLLHQPAYLAGATRAAEFLLSTLVRDDELLRTYRQGQAKIPGMLDDYAMLAHGLLELSLASTGQVARNHLDAAEAFIDEARVRFGDGAGGWFDTQADQGDLFVRARSTYDGAMPSAMSVMANNLVDLAKLTGLGEHAEAAAKALVSISGPIAHSPISTANSDRALLSMLGEFEPDLVAALAEAGAGEARPRPAPGANPVEVFAAEESVEVGPDLPGELHLRIQIARGYHLIAANPGPAPSAQGLLPTRVGISGGAGVRIFADYPAGTPLDPDSADTPLVYEGTIEFPLALELAGEWVGAPRVTLAFQACTDSECLQPRTITLDVELKRTS